MKILARTILASAVLSTSAFMSNTSGAPTDSCWPQWRGPTRNGISTEKGVPNAFPKEGLKLLWKSRLPSSLLRRLQLLG